ncbi:hypothetical protein [Bacillus sp. Marseille-P3800]|uniref:hypothetical protein n=1 Tax=Bacillus sp. Marseille-P3800 TaxID=2014782 RepID=UPI000C071427|nr:hypothetical protein [Bacillus sp. Marseille-P3800]
MYSSVVKDFRQFIKQSKAQPQHFMSVRDKHYYIEGMQVGKQIVEQSMEFGLTMPHELFDEIVGKLKEEYTLDELVDMVKDAYGDEDLGEADENI